MIQHLAAIKLSGLDNIIVCLNKLDLVSKEVAMERYQELEKVLKSYDIVPKNIIPTSFNKNIGVSWLLEEILTHFHPPQETDDDARFLATRSFDINKAGSDWTELKGGVIGGSLFNGTIQVNDTIEIRPGICGKGKDGKLQTVEEWDGVYR